MGLISRLAEILEDSRRLFEEWMEAEAMEPFSLVQQVKGESGPKSAVTENRLVLGDNLEYMGRLLREEQMAGRLDLIYVDPPFYSKADYGSEIKLSADGTDKIPAMRQKAYHDTWENGMEEYLRMLTVRFFAMRELLSDTGSLWVHLDWHVVHYVKVILDEIFGEKHFVNEVVWNYKSGGTSKRYFARKHDTLLFYAKTGQYYFQPQQEKSYNRGLRPYRFHGVSEYRDEVGWYTLVNRKDVWQIDMVGRTASERTGYATQKPEQLLCRILESCTREGDLCADFFGGSGTLAAAAEKMNRGWISCDAGKLAALCACKRLLKKGASFGIYEKDGAALLSKKENRLAWELSLQPADSSDRMMLEIRLTGFDPGNIDQLPVEERHREVIREILRKDSLQLLDCWCVDSDYDGSVIRGEQWFVREGGTLPLSHRMLWKPGARMAVRATDVFGNTAIEVICPETAAGIEPRK